MDHAVLHLAPAEWQVMECLWEAAPRSGRELTEEMEARLGWKRSTTLTLLRRLEDKGAVAAAQESGRKVFRPLVQREEAALREAEDLLSRVYHGSLSLMVSAFTRKQALSPEEVRQLRALLDTLEEAKET